MRCRRMLWQFKVKNVDVVVVLLLFVALVVLFRIGTKLMFICSKER